MTGATASPEPVEGAREVRDEDAFDVVAMAGWLRAHAADPTGLDGLPDVRQFSGGASNLTYLLSYPDGPDLILRRPPAGRKARGAHDMGREHDLQAALAPVFPYVPAMVARCADESVIGSEFYVMRRIEGTILRKDIPADLGLGPADVRRLCERAVDTLVALHRVDPVATGVARFGKGPGYVGRQVAGWTVRYRQARTPDVGDFDAVIGWIEANAPEDCGQVVVHNDFRFDNLVLAPDDPSRIVGVLDWELAAIGDPWMDLGSSLAYWVQADDDPVFQQMRLQPTNAAGMLTRAEVIARYSAASGRSMTPERWRFYEVFGLFRLAGIAQQIYYRYHHGQTTNQAFAMMGLAVGVLEARCLGLIAQA